MTKTSGSATRHYIHGIEYLGTSIEFIHTEEGVARRSGSSYSYEYNLRDHLGNTRATIYRNPSSGNIEVLQRDDYYPFGLRKITTAGSNDNKYLYNGKELQDELGQYDYGARFYDPVIGRWNVVDPLAEKYNTIAPYAYVANNPVRLIDTDGREIVDPKGRPVTITRNQQGALTFSKNATTSIMRVANALNLTSTGRQQLDNLTASDIKVKININPDSKIHRRADGKTVYTFGETYQGNNDESDNYGRYQDNDGSFGTKESQIMLYEGTIKEGINDANGLRLRGLTLEQAIGAIAGHESVHATDKKEISKDIAAQLEGQNRHAKEREAKPEDIENRIIKESKEL